MRSQQQQADAAAERRRAFLWHVATFAWVMVLLTVIDVLTGTDRWFIGWVAAIWGTILGVHFVDAFVLGGFLGFHAMECGPHRRHRGEAERANTETTDAA